MKARAILTGIAALAAFSCSSPQPASRSVPSSREEERIEKIENGDTEWELWVQGHIIARTPLWVGIEVGEEGKLHVDASDEQLRELQGKYAKILVYACDRGPEHGYAGMAWEIQAKEVARPATFRLPGEDVNWWDVYPIRVDGYLANGSSEVLLELPIRQGPVWEDLLVDPLHIRFSRYVEYVTRDVDWRGVLHEERSAMVKIWIEPEQAGLKRRFESIEVKISALKNPIRFVVREAVGMTACIRGPRIPGDEKVVLEYVDGIADDGKRTKLYAW